VGKTGLVVMGGVIPTVTVTVTVTVCAVLPICTDELDRSQVGGG
jgi:hypothetical protein